ncbi:MAG: aldo/keto reductase, partial [Sediminibacterium sp.]|nr:aldo/keto reductase [Sediminibacterium sp.]
MEYRRMGRSGLQLSVLSFGSWVTFHKQINDNSADELMGIAYDNGINFFDNAEVYALGESEKMMGRVLKAKNWDRTSYTLSSKAFFGWRGKENKPNQTGLSRKHLTEACNEALQRLQTDYLDLFSFHGVNLPEHYDYIFGKTSIADCPYDNCYQVIEEYRQAGKIRHVGFTTHACTELIIKLINTDKFEYCNLHYHYFGSYTASGGY